MRIVQNKEKEKKARKRGVRRGKEMEEWGLVYSLLGVTKDTIELYIHMILRM